MSTLILAAGTQSRWNHNLPADCEKIKQLVKVSGEPLIVRTQKQFKDTVVITNYDDISLHSTIAYRPENHRYLLETLHNTRDLWNGKMTILLGDVFYRDKCVQMIKKCKELMFFGNNIEIFALVFPVEDYALVKLAISNLVIQSIQGKIRCKLWHLYRQVNKIHLDQHRIEGMFTKVMDGTQDFDNWDQYAKYAKGKTI